MCLFASRCMYICLYVCVCASLGVLYVCLLNAKQYFFLQSSSSDEGQHIKLNATHTSDRSHHLHLPSSKDEGSVRYVYILVTIAIVCGCRLHKIISLFFFLLLFFSSFFSVSKDILYQQTVRYLINLHSLGHKINFKKVYR